MFYLSKPRSMKPIHSQEQPSISKEIIANLTDEQLREIEGGVGAADGTSCWSTTCNGTQTVQQQVEE